jgi:hypothetical protein
VGFSDRGIPNADGLADCVDSFTGGLTRLPALGLQIGENAAEKIDDFPPLSIDASPVGLSDGGANVRSEACR